MVKSFKIRIYPTKEQEKKMWQHIGACRYIWNYMLLDQQRRYESAEIADKRVSAFQMVRDLTPLKRDGSHAWLYEVSNKSLQITCQDIAEAYRHFFRKNRGRPKLKSKKHSKPTYPVNSENFYFKDSSALNIEKIGKVKYKTDFTFPKGTKAQKFTNVRVSYVSNKWFVSFGFECESQALELTDMPLGVDLGIKEFAVVAFGEDQKLVFHNINKSKRMRSLNRQMIHIQRDISRKYEKNKRGNVYVKTNNILRAEAKLRQIRSKIKNIRNNYIHQTTHALIFLHPKRVVVENLNVRGMIQNKHLSKSIQEQCFHEFKRQMQYKCEWSGIEFVQADRFYPSSKTCSACGCIKSDLKLNDRMYECRDCGAVIDRDYNAAINLMRYTV